MIQRVAETPVVEVPSSTVRISSTPEYVRDALIGSGYCAIHVLVGNRGQRSQRFNELQSLVSM